MSLRIIIAIIVLIILLAPVHSPAGMDVLSEGELSLVIAGAGVSVEISGSTARIMADSFYVWDTTDHNLTTPEIEFNKIEFNDIVIDDGGGGFSFDTPAGNPLSIDVGADASGGTIIRISGGEAAHLFIPFFGIPVPCVASLFSSGSEPRYYSAGGIVFCDQDIGGLYMDSVAWRDEIVNIGAHGGVDFDYAGRLDIGEFRYAYNTLPASLAASGIHLAGSAAGAPDSPSAWEFTGPFKVGDISNNPATIDVGTDSSDRTSLLLSLPMQGCLRVENVNFDGTDFGPCAIDGIVVHRLQVQIPGS